MRVVKKVSAKQRSVLLNKTSLVAFSVSQMIFILIWPFVHKFTHYLNIVAPFICWACLTLVVYLAFHVIKKEPIEIRSPYWKVGFILYSACLLVLLFDRPEHHGMRSYNLIPFRTIRFYFTSRINPLVSFYNLVANIALFVPYGYLLMVLINKKRVWFLSSIPVISIALIEVLQFVTRRGQLDIDDLILNVLGFVIGYVLYPFLKRYLLFKGKDHKEKFQNPIQ